jgi:hypothetical protein
VILKIAAATSSRFQPRSVCRVHDLSREKDQIGAVAPGVVIVRLVPYHDNN